MSAKIRVLIVDDSPLMQRALRAVLEESGLIEVAGFASDGREGVEKTAALRPDVVTMDIRMPVMGGLEAIERIMESTPVPIVVVSRLEVDILVRALGLGAMDFVLVSDEMSVIAGTIVDKVKIASRIRAIRRIKFSPGAAAASRGIGKGAGKVVVIGASTGGPQALREVLLRMPPDLPFPVLVVQHIAKGFIGGLAEWLGLGLTFRVKVAEKDDRLSGGTVFLAPDGQHMEVQKDGRIVFRAESQAGPGAALHKPSIDALMCSAAESFGQKAVGVIMTGMGTDGAEGMRRIKALGGKTVAQDERTSVVFGMNRMAIENGHADHVVPLENIAGQVLKLL